VALTIIVPLAQSASQPDLIGLQGLLQRRIPQHADKFHFSLVNGTGDSFVVSDRTGSPGAISVECTTLSACARGLYTYVLILRDARSLIVFTGIALR
jgi:alpha-N-acetylglucosaminidase